MDLPLRHKANGHICKAVHATAQSIWRASVAPSLHGQEGGKVSAARGNTDSRAPPNGEKVQCSVVQGKGKKGVLG
uniref:Uncharacterized protein n=1 Tax=Chromera velia CCMP2878 TaxID=1169474 RepID=A0A0G4HS44_9ALVE|eukprot:Cvel_8173.t1-p1 / transcript=Cvel_8173.t1 / gene=Cvel_8173 / organism=Chromera_velia_CCMP2878 / gene_product=hypothetical protein / transcript_product=hypothetical protein / location=Cvel_scaffold445:53084-53305(+) / protein_length=74 / sequence_SO=supercontig / SO=protein_coding / is_pseudo=false